MKGDTRCVDGRLMRHDPQDDDPDLETDRGVCPKCEGHGCDGIHGTNGSRGPTEAETRAYQSAFDEIARQFKDSAGFFENSPISPYTPTIDGDVDLLAVVRAVIRSLWPTTDEMKKAGAQLLPCYVSPSAQEDEENADSVFGGMIDAASPEIKP